MQFMAMVKMVVGILPMLIQVIVQIEEAFPQSGQGGGKLELVKQILQGTVEASEDMEKGQFEAMWGALQKVVGAIVALANSSGAFKH